MKTCKDCLHSKVCRDWWGEQEKNIFRKVISLAGYSPTVPNGCIFPVKSETQYSVTVSYLQTVMLEK